MTSCKLARRGDRMRYVTFRLLRLLSAAVLLAASTGSAAAVAVSRVWVNHQPIYWPDWADGHVQYAADSISNGGAHPADNLTNIFGLQDRVAAYQFGPSNSLANCDSGAGYAVCYSGSLIDNVRSLSDAAMPGYDANPFDGYREARGWTDGKGNTRMDMVGSCYHHALGPVLPKAVLRKKFWDWAPIVAAANWCETAEQKLGRADPWRIAAPHESGADPNAAEKAWHIYLAGLDSRFNDLGGLGNDDECKPPLANRRAIDYLRNHGLDQASLSATDETAPSMLRPQRFPYNPGGYTFGWFNSTSEDGAYRKKMGSDFYVWTHVYDVSGIPDGCMKLFVRADYDGYNPVDSIQNETFEGGSGVGGWIEIPMTKRVLPSTTEELNALADNGQINYEFDPAAVADYYFAKVTQFRGQLVDYYVEATDSKGNMTRSDIQHVWVGDDGTPPTGQISLPYVDADGVERISPLCRILSGDETVLDDDWYVVTGAVTNDARIVVSGDVNLILADGAELVAKKGVNVAVANNTTNSLTVWAQSDGEGMGSLAATSAGVSIGGKGSDRGVLGNSALPSATGWMINIYSTPNITPLKNCVKGSSFSSLNGINPKTMVPVDFTLSYVPGRLSFTLEQDGKTATASQNVDLAQTFGDKFAYLSISGGTVTATGADGIYARCGITLGWTKPADSIAASSFSSGDGVTVKAGQPFADERLNLYEGTLDIDALVAVRNKTLRPYMPRPSFTDTEGNEIEDTAVIDWLAENGFTPFMPISPTTATNRGSRRNNPQIVGGMAEALRLEMGDWHW